MGISCHIPVKTEILKFHFCKDFLFQGMMKKNGRTFRVRKRKRSDLSTENVVKCQQYKYVEFMKWLRKNGFQERLKLRLYEFNETGRGVMTVKAIQPGTTFVSIPEKLLITPDYVLGTYVKCQTKRLSEELSGMEILVLFLMSEKSEGQASKWFPYFSTLPEKYETPVLLESSSWRVLPSSLRESYAEKMREIKKSFHKILKFLSNLKLSKKACFDLFIWAFFTVNTRAVYKECEHVNCGNDSCGFNLALAPYLDFLNHHWEAKVEAGFNKNNRCYEITSYSSYKQYSQIFINYGGHSNRKLLMEYGFIQEENVNDIVPIFLDDIKLALKKYNGETLLPDMMSILNEHLQSKIGINIDGMTWSLETILKVICEKDKSRWKNMVLGISATNNNSEYKKLVQELVRAKLEEYNGINSLSKTGDSRFSAYMHSTLYRLLTMELNILQKEKRRRLLGTTLV